MALIRVLVVETNSKEREAVTHGLTRYGFEVQAASYGRRAINLVRNFNPDVVVLRLCLAESDGFDTCQKLKKSTDAPIIGICDHEDREHRLAFLAAGGHGYFPSPCTAMEMAALVRNHVRDQIDGDTPAVLRCGALEIDPCSMQVRHHGGILNLTPSEWKLLLDLAAHRGEVRTYQEIGQAVWEDATADPHTIQNHIARLRSKIEPGRDGPSQIEPVRQVGYRFQPDNP